MTWSEVKKAALQRMFLPTGEGEMASEAAADYLRGMPAAANEAALLLCTAAKPLVQWVELPAETVAQRVDLRALAPDYYSLAGRQVVFSAAGNRAPCHDWVLEGDRWMILPPRSEGSFTIYYNAYPPVLTETTADEFELPLCPEAAALLPAYIASVLYKEDDAALATTLRNEFESGVARLIPDAGRAGREDFVSESGWS